MTFLLMALLMLACKSANPVRVEPETAEPSAPVEFDTLSTTSSRSQSFDTQAAINALVEMENTHFTLFKNGLSPYYGTAWREHAESQFEEKISENNYTDYASKLGTDADSLHCTLYAMVGLKAGLGDDFNSFDSLHTHQYNGHEHAGWSVGRILVDEYGWSAYLIVDHVIGSPDYVTCIKNYEQSQVYDVWRQKDIALENMYIRGQDDSLITDLLSKHEFGWGFSDQGFHTWVTRYESLKECNWLGAPSEEFDTFFAQLFIKTPFLDYYDYHSHVVVFPPE
jgi:hypothetical protein